MNTIIFQTIRAGIIVGVAFFAFVDSAFAMPMLTLVSVSHLTGTSATITGHVSDPYNTSTVWFEWGVGSYVYNPTTVAVQGIYGDGSFEWNLQNLVPGQTYSYRSAAMEGGMLVYSPVSSFVTPITTSQSVVVSSQSGSTSFHSNGNPTTVAPAQAAPAVVSPIKQVAPAASTEDNGFTNNNSAAVIGAGDGMLPTTLLGWLALIIAILVMVTVAHMIYEAPEKRKKALAEKKEEENKQNLSLKTV